MKLKNILKKYKVFLILLIINVILGLLIPEIGISSSKIIKDSILQMLGVLPAVFILLGLLDVCVKKETIIKFLGKGSGLKGMLLSIFMGSAAAGPLYAAFPIATTMLKKEASLFNIFIFIGAWSTTKIPMLTFEAASLGLVFTGTRLLLSIIGIIIIAYITEKTLSEEDKQQVYKLGQEEL